MTRRRKTGMTASRRKSASPPRAPWPPAACQRRWPTLKRGLAIDPAWTDGLWKIGLVLYQSDQFEAALPYLHKLTEVDPTKGAGWALLGMCELQAGHPREAVEHIDHADRAGITDQYYLWEIAYLDRGLAHIALGDFGKATELLSKLAPREDPDGRARLMLALGLPRCACGWTIRSPPSKVPWCKQLGKPAI